MSSSYISARFEKTDLTGTAGKFRCIVRELDDGPVPPPPSPGYYPTSPDSLGNFLVLEYVSDVIGERLVRVATLADLSTYLPTRLTGFEVPTADFVAAGVLSGDKIRISPPNDAWWQSEEYPASPFEFTIASVVSPTRLIVSNDIPCFFTNMSWTVVGKTSGILNGTPRRATFPSGGTRFLDSRVNLYYDNVADMDAFILATKANLDALASASTTTTLTSESYSTP